MEVKLSSNTKKWNLRFLKLAKFISKFSKDPSTKVGAVIVDKNNRVLGFGYNGLPRKVKDKKKRYKNRKLKYSMIVHAEDNALMNATASVEGAKIYVYPTLMKPACCNKCTQRIIQEGISEVIYYDTKTNKRWEKEEKISKLMLEEAGVKCTPIEKE